MNLKKNNIVVYIKIFCKDHQKKSGGRKKKHKWQKIHPKSIK